MAKAQLFPFSACRPRGRTRRPAVSIQRGTINAKQALQLLMEGVDFKQAAAAAAQMREQLHLHLHLHNWLAESGACTVSDWVGNQHLSRCCSATAAHAATPRAAVLYNKRQGLNSGAVHV